MFAWERETSVCPRSNGDAIPISCTEYFYKLPHMIRAQDRRPEKGCPRAQSSRNRLRQSSHCTRVRGRVHISTDMPSVWEYQQESARSFFRAEPSGAVCPLFGGLYLRCFKNKADIAYMSYHEE